MNDPLPVTIVYDVYEQGGNFRVIGPPSLGENGLVTKELPQGKFFGTYEAKMASMPPNMGRSLNEMEFAAWLKSTGAVQIPRSEHSPVIRVIECQMAIAQLGS